MLNLAIVVFALCVAVSTLSYDACTTTIVCPPAQGPMCGDSFFCRVGQICCPNMDFHCADPDKVGEQCPH